MGKISISYMEKRQDSEFYNPTLKWKKRIPLKTVLLDGGRFKDYFTKKEWKKQLKRLRERRAYRKNNGMLVKKEWQRIREKQKKAFGGCVYCGSKENLLLDHILKYDSGNGIEEKEVNLILACDSCNKRKLNMDVFEFCRRSKIDVPNVIIDRLEVMR